MAKLLKLIAEKGVDRDVYPWIGNALGLTGPGQTWAARSISTTDKDGIVHGLFISRGAEQDLVITISAPGKTGYGYRARRDGTATAAFIYDPQTQRYTMRVPAEAQKSLDVELAHWSDVAATNN